MIEWVSKYYGVLIVLFFNSLAIGNVVYSEFKDEFSKVLWKGQNNLDKLG